MTNFNMIGSPAGPDPKRLLLAVVATSAVLLGYSYFFPPAVSVPVAQNAPTQNAAPHDAPSFGHVVPAHENATGFVSEQPVTFSLKETTDQRTSYTVTVNNLGGVIERFALTDFSKDAVIFDQKTLGSSLLRISSLSTDAAFNERSPYEVVSHDEKSIVLRHVTNQGLAIERHYRFHDKATITESISFKNLSSAPVRLQPKFFGVKRDVNVVEPSFFNTGVQGQNIAVKTFDDYERLSYGDLKDKNKQMSSVKYVAFDDQFFLAAILPNYATEIESAHLNVKEEEKKSKTAQITLTLKPFVLLNGEEKKFTHQFFIGPKQIDLLSSLTPPLDENIDFGWFGVLSRPMLWLLVQIYGFVNNYGLAIILITFVIKMLTYPLTQKSYQSQQQMKTLQPKIKELQQKFGHDRTLQGQKQMELYKQHGVNPVSGCLPILVQFPIWIAFFQMLRNSVELYDQPFYWWITDLTLPDQFYVMPILMGATMLIQQAFTPPPADQPQMKYVMWSMPIFLTFIMLNMPSGLSLYMLTNNLLTIIQQLIIKRQSEKVNA
jgi:YidC/Oxa1 family membrane protein insertase